MDANPRDETPEAILDAIRDRADWSDAERSEALSRLVTYHSPARIRQVLESRLADLDGPHGEAVLMLLEAFGTDELLHRLADVIEARDDLTPERSWQALSLLAGTDLIEARPALAERIADLEEVLDDHDALIDELAGQIGDDPDGIWLTLHGLENIEPEVRGEIVASLAERSSGPGLIELLRLLCHAPDAPTRRAAVTALQAQPIDDPDVESVWTRLAAEPSDPETAEAARSALARVVAGTEIVPTSSKPALASSVVTALDGDGRGQVVIRSRHGSDWVAAAFTCDVLDGVIAADGVRCPDEAPARAFTASYATRPELDAIEDAHELALGLLAGSLLLNGPNLAPSVRYWLEQTAGTSALARPFADWSEEPNPRPVTLAEVQALFEACPAWADTSELTRDLAEEWRLCEPDPVRDEGLFRVLFERCLQHRVELDRRRLSWMAAFWHASGATDLARVARALAAELSDAQNVVPNHPFFRVLAANSLAANSEPLRLDGTD